MADENNIQQDDNIARHQSPAFRPLQPPTWYPPIVSSGAGPEMIPLFWPPPNYPIPPPEFLYRPPTPPYQRFTDYGTEIDMNEPESIDQTFAMIHYWISEDQFHNPFPESDKCNPSACLFVASLNIHKSEDQLTNSVGKYFGQFGQVRNVKVHTDPANRPYAFVQFDKEEDARRAMQEAQHTFLDNRVIRIEKAKVNRTLNIQQIQSNIPETRLHSVFEKFGPLEDFNYKQSQSQSVSDEKAGEKYATLTIKFVHREDALRAYSCIRSVTPWFVEWSSTSWTSTTDRARTLSTMSELTDSKSIYIGHLNPNDVTQDLIRSRFEVYGPIESIQLINKPHQDMPGGEIRFGFAFVRFENENSARLAIEGENDQVFLDYPIKVRTKQVRNRNHSGISSGSSSGGMKGRRANSWPLTQPMMQFLVPANSVNPEQIQYFMMPNYPPPHPYFPMNMMPAYYPHPVPPPAVHPGNISEERVVDYE